MKLLCMMTELTATAGETREIDIRNKQQRGSRLAATTIKSKIFSSLPLPRPLPYGASISVDDIFRGVRGTLCAAYKDGAGECRAVVATQNGIGQFAIRLPAKSPTTQFWIPMPASINKSGSFGLVAKNL